MRKKNFIIDEDYRYRHVILPKTSVQRSIENRLEDVRFPSTINSLAEVSHTRSRGGRTGSR